MVQTPHEQKRRHRSDDFCRSFLELGDSTRPRKFLHHLPRERRTAVNLFFSFLYFAFRGRITLSGLTCCGFGGGVWRREGEGKLCWDIESCMF